MKRLHTIPRESSLPNLSPDTKAAISRIYNLGYRFIYETKTNSVKYRNSQFGPDWGTLTAYLINDFRHSTFVFDNSMIEVVYEAPA